MLSADVTMRQPFHPPVRQPASAAGSMNKAMLYGDRSFLVWNSLPVALRSPDTTLDILKDKLKILSTKCASAALANLHGINHLIIIIIIIIIYVYIYIYMQYTYRVYINLLFI